MAEASKALSVTRRPTVRWLARIMFEELDREDWGHVDPYWFQQVADLLAGAQKPEDGYEEAANLKKVLQRVCRRL